MTASYRTNRDIILDSENQNLELLPLSETFEAAAFNAVLNQDGCKGIRIYYGMNADLQVHAIIVGVNANNEDLLPEDSTTTEDSNIIDEGIRCPPRCPPSSVLNS
jgi:hypothetical protein